MKVKGFLTILMLMALIVSCAGPGVRKEIPLTMPDGEKATIVVHNQIWPSWMRSKAMSEIDYIVKGDVTPKQLEAVAKVEGACRISDATVTPNGTVAVFSQGILYAAAGFVGVGIGSQAFAGVNSLAYGAYGASATGVAGLANGTVTLGSHVYNFEGCNREILGGLFPQYGIRVLQKSPY